MDDFVYFRLRLPSKLKETIEKEAKKNNRSMNSEILSMIQNNIAKKTGISDVADYVVELENMQKTMVEISNQFINELKKKENK